jgi:hypothetical protein
LGAKKLALERVKEKSKIQLKILKLKRFFSFLAAFYF